MTNEDLEFHLGMSPDRWAEVKDMVKDKFPSCVERREPLASGEPGAVEIVEFVSPAGRIRLEWTDRPLRLATRALGSKRIGSSTTVVHEYSESERVHRFSAYRWEVGSNDWVPMRGAEDVFAPPDASR